MLKIKTHYCLKYLIQVQATPEAGEITLINADGAVINTILDDGNGNGNMLVQRRDGDNYIYVTVTEKDKIINGKWTVRYQHLTLQSSHLI